MTRFDDDHDVVEAHLGPKTKTMSRRELEMKNRRTATHTVVAILGLMLAALALTACGGEDAGDRQRAAERELVERNEQVAVATDGDAEAHVDDTDDADAHDDGDADADADAHDDGDADAHDDGDADAHDDGDADAHDDGDADGDASSLEAAPKDALFLVRMTNFAFTPDVLEVNAGEVIEIAVQNVEPVLHDFTIDKIDADVHISYLGGTGEHAHSEGGDMAMEMATPDVHFALTEPGSGVVHIKVHEPGEYVIYCTVPGHRELGMVGTLIVR